MESVSAHLRRVTWHDTMSIGNAQLHEVLATTCELDIMRGEGILSQ